MPKGSRVEMVYQSLLQKGKSKGSAARIAQASTGQSLKTGKKSKGKYGHKYNRVGKKRS